MALIQLINCSDQNEKILCSFNTQADAQEIIGKLLEEKSLIGMGDSACYNLYRDKDKTSVIFIE